MSLPTAATDAPLRRIVLLGHSGFIGRPTMTWLSKWAAVQSSRVDIEGLSYPEVDLANPTSAAQLDARLDDKTSVVMLSGIKRQKGDCADIFRRNLDMVLHVAERMDRCGVRRMVYVSSAAVYGEEIHNLAIDEETPVQPQTFYGIAKYASERLLGRWASAAPGRGLVCVRPPLVYGPGDDSCGYGPAGFFLAASCRQPVVLWGDGSERREFLFVDDLARLLAELAFSDFCGILNAASGVSHSYMDVLDGVRRAWPALHVERRERTKEKVDNVFNPLRLRQALAFFRFTPLAEGLTAMAAQNTVS